MMNREEYTSAAAIFRRLLAVDGDNYECWKQLGRAASKMGLVNVAARCSDIAESKARPDVIMQTKATTELLNSLRDLAKAAKYAELVKKVSSILQAERPHDGDHAHIRALLLARLQQDYWQRRMQHTIKRP